MSMAPIFQARLDPDGTMSVPQAERFRQWVMRLCKKSRDAEIIVRPMQTEFRLRNNQQNRYYWGCVLDILASEWGYGKEELHELLLHRHSRVPQQGKPSRVERTSDMSVEEFCSYVDRIKRWAIVEYGIHVPSAGEVDLVA